MKEYDDIEKEILKDLYMSDSYLPMDYFVSHYACSIRTIQLMVSNLKNQNYHIEYKRNHGYILTNKEDVDIKSLFGKRIENVSNKKIRLLTEITIVLLASRYTSLSFLSEKLFISKSLAKQDMDVIDKFLLDEGIHLVKTNRGHYVDLDVQKKINIVLNAFEKLNLSVDAIESVFLNVMDIDYHSVFSIFSKHLINHDISLEDDVMIRYVNYLILLDCVKNTDFGDIQNLYGTYYEDWFLELKNELDTVLKLNSQCWILAENMYHALILRLPTQQIKDSALQVVKEYSNVCEKQFDIYYTDSEMNLLLLFFEQWIIDYSLEIQHNRMHVNEIKKSYIEAYEIAMSVGFNLEENGYQYNEGDLAYFALFLNDILVNRKKIFEEKIRIILIYNVDMMVFYHVKKTIENTVDNRLFTIEGMNLYKFNKEVQNLNPSTTLVLDTSRGSDYSCLKYNISNIRIYPLLLSKDIEQIQKKVVEKRRDHYNAYLLSRIKKCKSEIHLFKNEWKDLDVKTQFYVDDMLIVQTLNTESELNVYVTDKIMIQYAYGKNMNIQLAKNYLIKNFTSQEIKACDDIYDLMVSKLKKR